MTGRRLGWRALRGTAAGLATLLLAGCASASAATSNPDTRRVFSAIDKTRSMPRGFVFSLLQDGTETTVRGVIEDDQRYRAQVSVNGTPVLDEVSVDDAVAVRSLTDAGLKTMTCPVVALGQAQLNPKTRRSFNALLAHRWVLDKVGAPSLLPRNARTKVFGDDPVVDALTVFDYLDNAVDASVGAQLQGFVFTKFDKESITYNPKKDPLPLPGKGVIRYDLFRKDLPKKSALDSGTNDSKNAITDANLRKSAVYLKDGQVVEYRDTIDMRLFVKDIEDIIGAPKKSALTLDQRATLSLQGLNLYLVRKGQPRISQHAMAVRFFDATGEPPVTLPSGAVQGPLDFLKDHGRSAFDSVDDIGCRGSVDSQEASELKALTGQRSG